jgi:MFS family permease
MAKSTDGDDTVADRVPRSSASEVRSVAEIKDILGWSRYQWRLFAITGLCIMAESIEVSLLSFLTSEGKREWGLSSAMANNIAGAVFVGEIVGCVAFGLFADWRGRKPAFALGIVIVTAFALASCFSRNVYELIFARFGVGVGIGGFSVPYDLLCEFCPNASRGTVMMSLWMFFALGSLLVVQVASVMLESQGWRWLCAYSAIPPALSVIGLFWVDESPNWLAVKGRREEAEAILLKAAKMNKVDLGPLELEHVDTGHLDVSILFTGSATATTMCIWIMSFAQCFCYYGIVLFLPHAMEVLTGQSLEIPSLGSSSPANKYPYWALTVSCSGEVIANVIALLVINSYPRGKLASFFFFGFAVTFPLIVSGVVDSVMVASAMLARLCAANAGNITWLATPEAYPTQVRATGHSWGNLLARSGALCATYWGARDDTTVVAIGFSTMAIIASTAAYHLPPGVMPGSNPRELLTKAGERVKINKPNQTP